MITYAVLQEKDLCSVRDYESLDLEENEQVIAIFENKKDAIDFADYKGKDTLKQYITNVLKMCAIRLNQFEGEDTTFIHNAIERLEKFS